MKNISLILFLVPVLTSCVSNLSIKVDIIDREKIKALPAVLESTVQAKAERIIANRQSNRYEKAKDDLKAEIDKALKKAGEEVEKIKKEKEEEKNQIQGFVPQQLTETIATLTILETSVDNKRTQINNIIDDTFRRANSYYNSALSNYQQSLASPGDKTLLIAANVDIISGDLALENLVQTLTDKFKELSGKLDKVGIYNSLYTLNTVALGEITSLTRDSGILNDPLASSIVGAPLDYWKESYNETLASTYFGNSDIAIVMESLGHFTLKGVRLDASQIADTTQKVMTQAVGIFASAYGVSVNAATDPTNKGGTPGSQNLTSGAEINDVEAKQIQFEAQERLAKQAALGILDAILSQRSNILGSSQELRKQAIISVKNSFSAYKTQLEANLGQQGGVEK